MFDFRYFSDKSKVTLCEETRFWIKTRKKPPFINTGSGPRSSSDDLRLHRGSRPVRLFPGKTPTGTLLHVPKLVDGKGVFVLSETPTSLVTYVDVTSGLVVMSVFRDL